MRARGVRTQTHTHTHDTQIQDNRIEFVDGAVLFRVIVSHWRYICINLLLLLVDVICINENSCQFKFNLILNGFLNHYLVSAVSYACKWYIIFVFIYFQSFDWIGRWLNGWLFNSTTHRWSDYMRAYTRLKMSISQKWKIKFVYMVKNQIYCTQPGRQTATIYYNITTCTLHRQIETAFPINLN